ncbi:hypothetical protein Tco_1507199 [Tanacetum coccineum]
MIYLKVDFAKLIDSVKWDCRDDGLSLVDSVLNGVHAIRGSLVFWEGLYLISPLIIFAGQLKPGIFKDTDDPSTTVVSFILRRRTAGYGIYWNFFPFGFQEVIERFLGSKWSKGAASKKFGWWEVLVSSLSIGPLLFMWDSCGKKFFGLVPRLFVGFPILQRCSGDRIVLDDESAKINEQANNLNNDEAKNASEVVSNTYFGDNGEVQGFEHQHGESNDKEESSDPFQYHPIYLTNALKEVRTTDTSSSILYPPGLGRAMELILRSLKEAENPWTSLFESFSNGLSFKEDGSILEILEEMIYGGSNQWLFMEVLFLAFRLPVWYSTSQTTGLFYLRKFFSDFGPTPFRFYHSWLELLGFDDLVSKSWNSFTLDDSYGMIWFKKKLQILKKEIRAWISRRIRLAVRNGLLFMEVLYWMQNSSFVGPRPKVLIYVQTASFLLDSRFRKAYDSVRWDYLDDVLISFGFGPKCVHWILEYSHCLLTLSYLLKSSLREGLYFS